MSSIRKRGVRIKTFATSSTSTSVLTVPRSPLSPPSSTSQSDSPTPTLSHSSPDSLSPITPPFPPSSSSSLSDSKEAASHPSDDGLAVDTDALLASSLSSLSSSAPRHIPPSSPLYSLFAAWDELRATLPFHWRRWHALPLTLQLCVAFVALFYFLLFSCHTHLLLLTLYAAVLCAALSARSVVEERGLLAFVPSSALPLLSDYSLIQLSHMALSSQLTGDLIGLLCFDLDDRETRALMQRLPPQLRRALVRKGVIGLLPASVTSLLFPRRRLSVEALEEKVEVIDDAAEDSTMARSLREEEEGRREEEEKERLTAAHVLERKYDDDDFTSRVHASLSSQSLAPRDSLSLSAMAAAESEVAVVPLQPAFPAASRDAELPSSLSLSSIIDRRVSSSLSGLFRSWARQSCTALSDYVHDLLPTTITSSSSLHLFLPLASAIAAVHLLSSSSRARTLIHRSQPYVVDGAICVAAIAACHHLHHHLVDGFVRRKAERRVAHGEVGGGVSGVDRVRLYAWFVWRKVRLERGMHVSGLVLLAWLLYVAKGRARLREWWERRELLRLGAAAQLANRLAL